MGGIRVKLAGVCIRVAEHVACVAHNRDLHAKADAEVGDTLRARIVCCTNHAFHAACAEAARQDDAVNLTEQLVHGGVVDLLGVYPVDIDEAAGLVAAVLQCLCNRKVCVVQLDVLADQRDFHMVLAGCDALEHFLPLGHIALACADGQLTADDVGQMALLEHHRCLIQNRQGAVFDYAVLRYGAEHGNLALDIVIHRLVNAGYDDVRRDAQTAQLLNRVLGRLGLRLIGAGDERNQCYMDEQAVAAANLSSNLTDRLEERLGLNIAGGAANLGDNNVSRGLFAYRVDEGLDLVGDVRNNLHGLTEVLAGALLVQNIPVYLAGGQVGELVQVLVDEALVVA